MYLSSFSVESALAVARSSQNNALKSSFLPFLLSIWWWQLLFRDPLFPGPCCCQQYQQHHHQPRHAMTAAAAGGPFETSSRNQRHLIARGRCNVHLGAEMFIASNKVPCCDCLLLWGGSSRLPLFEIARPFVAGASLYSEGFGVNMSPLPAAALKVVPK